MTDPIIYNQTKITQQLFREGARKQLHKKYNRITAKIALILLAVLVVMAILMHAFSGNPSSLAVELILFVLILGWIRIALPRMECKRAYQAMVNRCGGNMPCRDLLFYEDHLLVRPQSGEPVSIGYQEITAVHETKHTLTLTCADSADVLIDKDGFHQGSTEEVRRLLNIHA